MIEVHGPDGAVIQFPAGTDPATIDRVMRERYAPATTAAPAASPPVAPPPAVGVPGQLPPVPTDASGPPMQTLDDWRTLPRFSGMSDEELTEQLRRERIQFENPLSVDPSSAALRQFNDQGRAMLSGASFNYWDELRGAMAGLNAVTQGGEYQPANETTVQAERAALQAFRERDPASATLAEIAGAIPVSAVGPLAAASRVGGTLLTRTAASGLTAAGQSAVAGYGAAEGTPSERVQAAMLPLAVGGIIGAAVPGIGVGIAQGSRIARQALGNALSPTIRARNQASGLLTEGDVSVSALADELATNPRLMPADVDPNLQQLLQGVATQPGRARTIVTRALNERQKTAAEAVRATYRDAFGEAPDPGALLMEAQATARRNADQNFGQALGQIDYVDARPALNAISASSLRSSFLDGVASDIADAGGNPEILHGIQWRLREYAQDLRTSAVGSERNQAKQVETIRQALVDAIDAPSAGLYRNAQSVYRDDMAIEGAFFRGFDVLSNPTKGKAAIEARPETLLRWLQAEGTTPAEIEAARQGALAAFEQAIMSTRRAASEGIALPDVGFNRQRMSILFGPEKAEELATRLAQERQMALTFSRGLHGSQTAANTAAQRVTAVPGWGAPVTASGLGAMVAVPMAVGYGSSMPIIASAAQSVGNFVARGVQRAVAKNTNAALARGITSQGREAQDFIRSLGVAPTYTSVQRMNDEARRRLIETILSPANRAVTPTLLAR